MPNDQRYQNYMYIYVLFFSIVFVTRVLLCHAAMFIESNSSVLLLWYWGNCTVSWPTANEITLTDFGTNFSDNQSLCWCHDGCDGVTSITIVYSTVYSCENQRKHQSSASLVFVRGIHRGPVSNAENVSIWWRHHVIKRSNTSQRCEMKKNTKITLLRLRKTEQAIKGY